MWSADPVSVDNPYRSRRVAQLAKLADYYIALNGACRILDIGGTADFWNTWKHALPWEKITILCVNIDIPPGSGETGEGNIQLIHGDATNLIGIESGRYDIAFSNSVLEHVGMWSDMQKFASEIKRVATSYYVQTPYYWFPLEVHARAPFLHWLPQPIAARLVMAKKLGFWEKAKDISEATAIIESSRLLDLAQFRSLFSDAKIEFERALGLPKSLIAIRGPAV